jgi:hypothetical protein
MCGLAGIAGDLTNKDTDIFKDLLTASVLRGADATGIATYRKNTKEVDLYKQAVESPSFLQNRRADRLITPMADVLLGHTRKSTESWTSKYSHDDAHPFRFDNTIGAHNGMIPVGALSNLPHSLKQAIDSENLIYNIHKIGVGPTLSKVWGAWALSLLDAETGKLSFIRNDQRPLAFAFSKDKRRLFWASESQMLHWILCRFGEPTFTEYPQILEPNTLLEFDLLSKEKIGDAWTMSKVEGGKEPEKKFTHSGAGARHGTTSHTKPVYSKPKSPEQVFLNSLEGLEKQLLGFDYSKRSTWAAKKRKRQQGLVTAIDKMYKAWEKGWQPEPESNVVSITPQRAIVKQKLLDDGCAFCCTTAVEEADLPFCTIGKEGEVLCHVCAVDETLLQIAQAPKPPTKPIALPNH